MSDLEEKLFAAFEAIKTAVADCIKEVVKEEISKQLEVINQTKSDDQSQC
jgi:hypothetical protein